MPSVLFVCTANICRSPVAEALFADWLRRNGVPGQWEVGSAGTWAQSGAPATAYSREVAAEQRLDLSQHRSRAVSAQLLAHADVVLCMTRSQCEALQIEFPEHAGRVHLLSAMAGAGHDIDDPYGGPKVGYGAMVAELQRLIEAGGARIVALALARQSSTSRG